nr:bacteriocin immunity protein [Pseudomonas indica]
MQGEELEKYLNDLAVHFDQVAGHPIGYELIYYPDLHGISDSPEKDEENFRLYRVGFHCLYERNLHRERSGDR